MTETDSIPPENNASHGVDVQRLIRWISAEKKAITIVPKGTQNGRVMQSDGAARHPLNMEESVNKIRHHAALKAFKSEQHLRSSESVLMRL